MTRSALPDREVLVRGGSMAPCLTEGDRVLLRPPGPGEPRPGQVVLVDGPVRVLHRVVGRRGGALWVRGDAHRGPGERVPTEHVVGVALWRVRSGRLEDLPGPATRRMPLPSPTRRPLPAWVRWCLPGPRPGPRPSRAEAARWTAGARRERLAPLLAHRLGRLLDLPPALEREGLLAAAAEALQSRWLGVLLDRLARAGVDVMPVKGLWLAHRAYPAPHLRPMNDADLLVHPGQVDRAHRVLGELGLHPIGTPPPARFRAGSGPASVLYRSPDRTFAAHLHWGLVNATVPLAHAGRGPDPWAEAGRGELLGSPVWEPAPEVHGALLLEHLARPGHLLRPLVRFVDLAWFEAGGGAGVLARAARLAQDTGWGRVIDAVLPAVLGFLRDGVLPGRRDRLRVAAAHLGGHVGPRNKMRFIFRTILPERRFLLLTQERVLPAPLAVAQRAARVLGAVLPEGSR